MPITSSIIADRAVRRVEEPRLQPAFLDWRIPDSPLVFEANARQRWWLIGLSPLPVVVTGALALAGIAFWKGAWPVGFIGTIVLLYLANPVSLVAASGHRLQIGADGIEYDGQRYFWADLQDVRIEVVELHHDCDGKEDGVLLFVWLEKKDGTKACVEATGLQQKGKFFDGLDEESLSHILAAYLRKYPIG